MDAMTARKSYSVVFTAHERAELRQVEMDTSELRPDEVSGHTRYTLVSAGTELAAYSLGNQYPHRPGYATVFEVEHTGGEVNDLSTGDYAFCMGKHSSHQRVGRKGTIPVPPQLAPEISTFARLMNPGMTALSTTVSRPPQKVLVMGLGLVGNLAAQIFASCGYEVIACDPVPERLEFASRAGIKSVYESPPLDDPDIRGNVSLVVECSGNEAAALDGCRMVARHGEVVLVGAHWTQRTTLSAHELLDTVFKNYVTLRSGWEWSLPLHEDGTSRNSTFGNIAAAMEWLAAGRIVVDGMYETVSPAEAGAVYQDLLHRRRPRLATVFDWNAV